MAGERLDFGRVFCAGDAVECDALADDPEACCIDEEDEEEEDDAAGAERVKELSERADDV